MNDFPRIGWVLGIASLCAIPLWVAWALETRRYWRLVGSRCTPTLRAEFPEADWDGLSFRETMRRLDHAQARLEQLIADDLPLQRSAAACKRLFIVTSALSALPLLYLAMYLTEGS